MNDQVYWMLELEIQPGQEQGFRALMKEMVAATMKDEPDTLAYEWSISGDGKRCNILERYTNSAATMQHMANFGEKYAARFLQVLSPKSFVVYGSPSQEVKDALAAFGATYMQPADGFTR
jgi:quinol monooxygenase YgiN